MKAILSRTYGDKETKGLFSVMEGCDRLYECKILELPWINNIPNISCIPAGEYVVKRYKSATRGICFKILNVKNRSDILIHPGNYVAGDKIDSKGCQLPGSGFKDINKDGFIDVINSKRTMDILRKILPNTFKLIII